MKKYRLILNDTAFIELSEEHFNKLTNVTCEFENAILKGKQFQVKIPNTKTDIIIITPIDNFEVIDDMENN